MALYPQIALVSPVYPGWYWRMKLASWFGSPVVEGLLSGNPDNGNCRRGEGAEDGINNGREPLLGGAETELFHEEGRDGTGDQ
jgi:hypothetical protein